MSVFYLYVLLSFLNGVTGVCVDYCVVLNLYVNNYTLTHTQGFMQDKIIASHTCFGGHMDVNC